MDTDNSAKIVELETLLQSGATSVNVDGVSVAINPDSVRIELRRLQAADSIERRKRPAAATINLSGF